MLPEIDQFLACSTPAAWVETALERQDVMLLDHKACEMKAAATAMQLIGKYSGRLDLVNKMSRLAREELRHFEQVLAILIQLVLMILILMLMGYGVGGFIMQLLIWSIIAVTSLFLKVFFFALIISVILSWVAPGSYNPGAQLVNQICEPLLMPFRKLLPNLGGLDLSPIFAFLALKLIDMLVINNLAAMTGMPQQLSIFL